MSLLLRPTRRLAYHTMTNSTPLIGRQQPRCSQEHLFRARKIEDRESAPVARGNDDRALSAGFTGGHWPEASNEAKCIQYVTSTFSPLLSAFSFSLYLHFLHSTSVFVIRYSLFDIRISPHPHSPILQSQNPAPAPFSTAAFPMPIAQLLNGIHQLLSGTTASIRLIYLYGHVPLTKFKLYCLCKNSDYSCLSRC